LLGQTQSASAFGEGGKEQIGTDGQIRLHSKEENQDGGHQRPTTNASETNYEADKKAGKNKAKFMHKGAIIGLLMQKLRIFWFYLYAFRE
jgi:hypothetical protein